MWKVWLQLTPLMAILASCASPARNVPAVAPGSELPRSGDEIVVCGRYFHTGAPVVLWTDPGGYDAYRVERRFVPWEEASWEKSAGNLKTPNRYGVRYGTDLGAEPPRSVARLSPDELERVRGGGWDLDTLRRVVDQLVIHYDAAGTSRTCFRVLQDVRGLSVHFMIDVDGTIYQTLDVKERAWHATVANDRSVGVEMANIGAYPSGSTGLQAGGSATALESGATLVPLARWYGRDAAGRPVLTIPPELDGGGVRTAGFVGRPLRPEAVAGEVNGREYRQWDFTPEQYGSLIRLTATLCRVLPGIRCECPRGEDGRVLTRTMTAGEFEGFSGVLGHWHIQENKVDPGPALQWERVLEGARGLIER